MNPAGVSTNSAILVEAAGLSRRFGDLLAVDSVELAIRRGEVFGFLGPNGAGKSTVFRMLLGLLAPTSGSIQVLGRRLPREADRVRGEVGYMPQRFALYDDLTVVENLEFAAEIFGLEPAVRQQRIAAQVDRLRLANRRAQRAGTLSGGWKQRLALAVATVHQPRLLFLDEPTAGVDPESRRQFWEEIFAFANEGTTVLVSTHYMDEAVRCHRLCLLLAGRRVAEGAPEDLTDALAGRVVEIETPRTGAAMALLRERPEVASAAQLGSLVRVLLKVSAAAAEVAAPRFDALLTAAGHQDVRVESVEPNLEDVFVAVTQGEKLAPTAGDEP